MIKPRGSNSTAQEFVSDLVRGKIVLDIGCVEHTASREASETWLHKHICNTAVSVTGVDIVAAEVERLVNKGYNVICADALRFDLGATFDVIVAGELIEHLDNPSGFLRNMLRHMGPDGRLVLTTPNVFFALHFIESVVSSPYKRWNPEHVSWYCFFTLENLLARNGLRMQECVYFARSRKVRSLLRWLHLPCPSILASTILVVAKRA